MNASHFNILKHTFQPQKMSNTCCWNLRDCINISKSYLIRLRYDSMSQDEALPTSPQPGALGLMAVLGCYQLPLPYRPEICQVSSLVLSPVTSSMTATNDSH